MNIEEIVKWIMSRLTSPTTAYKNSLKKAPSVSLENKPKLREEDGYFLWNKGEVFDLSTHFSTKEMSCHCSYETCKEQKISKDLIHKLEEVREEAAEPLIITSAYRCTDYQAHLRNSGANTVVAKKSTHELGEAVDVVPKSGMNDKFEPICAKRFSSIGLAKNFLHVDTRAGYRRWDY